MAYQIPQNPKNPATAALYVIWGLAQERAKAAARAALADTFTPAFLDTGIEIGMEQLVRPQLRALTQGLKDRAAFTGMTWRDASRAADAIAWSITLNNPARALQLRATAAATGRDEIDWDDRQRATEALTAALIEWPKTTAHT